MSGRSRPREATSVQKSMHGCGEREKAARVAVRRGWEREPWSLWIVRFGFRGVVRVGVRETVGRVWVVVGVDVLGFEFEFSVLLSTSESEWDFFSFMDESLSIEGFLEGDRF